MAAQDHVIAAGHVVRSCWTDLLIFSSQSQEYIYCEVVVEFWSSSFVFREWDGEEHVIFWVKAGAITGIVEAPFWRGNRGPYKPWSVCVFWELDADPVVL